MRVITVLLFLAVLGCLSLAPTVHAAGDSAPLLRAAQFLRVEAASMPELERTILELRHQGVNTLILRMFQNRGDRHHVLAPSTPQMGVYFVSREAPVVMDLLGSVVRVAHALGMKVFAWMPTCRFDWAVAQHRTWRDYAYDPSARVIRPVDRLDPFHPGVQSYLERLYAEVAAYDIDGILIQDDLISKYNQGFSPYARQLHLEEQRWLPIPAGLYRDIRLKDGGRPLYVDYTPKFWEWARWKNEKLLGLTARLIRSARRVRPDLKFAVNLYYETVMAPQEALAWYAQRLTPLLALPFDYYAVMAYHRQIREELRLSRQDTVWYISGITEHMAAVVGRPSSVLIKVQVVDWQTGAEIPSAELDQVLGAIARVKGVSLGYIPVRGRAVPRAVERHYLAER